jgi:hypothetical protein
MVEAMENISVILPITQSHIWNYFEEYNIFRGQAEILKLYIVMVYVQVSTSDLDLDF